MSALTGRLKLTAIIVSLGATQFGFHLAELNAPLDIITCSPATEVPGAVVPPYDCIPMSSQDIGIVNAIYSVGGFLGACAAGPLADRFGRRRMAFMNCLLFTIGSLLIGSAHSVPAMCIGRIIAGLGAGSAIVVTPLFLNEISPAHTRGLLGTLNQIQVNVGILIAQLLGVWLSTKEAWRVILYQGAVIAIINAALLPLCVESPKWLALNGMIEEAATSLRYLRGVHDVDDELLQWKHPDAADAEARGLLADPEAGSPAYSSQKQSKVGVVEFSTSPLFRKVFIATIGIMLCQQVCGVNSIIFYGVSVLKEALPQYSSLVNAIISLVNLVVTSSISPLVDKYGRKPLLLSSIGGMVVSSAVLARGLQDNNSVLAAVAATAFVIAFAIGLGPIPFLIISEMAPHSASGIAQSMGTAANWTASSLIAFLFPIMKTSLGASVFYIFTISGAAAFAFVYKFIPETKGKTQAELFK